MAEAIALAKELNDMAALGLALYWAGLLAHFEGNPAEVERLASELIELSTRQTFASWLPGGVVLTRLGAQRFRRHSRRHLVDRGRNTGLSSNGCGAASAIFSVPKG